MAHREDMARAQAPTARVEVVGREGSPKTEQGLCCLQRLPPGACPGKRQMLSAFLLHPAADKGSWCERELCACDKGVAFCMKRNLDSYKKHLRYYWRPHCKGQTPVC